MKCTMTILVLLGILSSTPSLAALPPHFSECMRETNSLVSIRALKEISQVSAVTYCQNQISTVSKYEIIELLKSPKVNVAISLARTNYLREDLLQMAKSGPFLLYVDSSKISKEYLPGLMLAGIDLVIMSNAAGLAQVDLLSLARTKSFVYNVNSRAVASDLSALVAAGVHVVIRNSDSGLTAADTIKVAQVNNSLVTILP